MQNQLYTPYDFIKQEKPPYKSTHKPQEAISNEWFEDIAWHVKISLLRLNQLRRSDQEDLMHSKYKGLIKKILCSPNICLLNLKSEYKTYLYVPHQKKNPEKKEPISHFIDTETES